MINRASVIFIGSYTLFSMSLLAVMTHDTKVYQTQKICHHIIRNR